MKNLIMTMACLFSITLTASGPSYDPYDMPIDGTETADTEALSCQKARLSAIDSVMNDTDDYGYEEFCTYEDEPEVVSSTCSCKSVTNKEFKCEYKATVTCYKEVWYN